jgi:hypothetical protein
VIESYCFRRRRCRCRNWDIVVSCRRRDGGTLLRLVRLVVKNYGDSSRLILCGGVDDATSWRSRLEFMRVVMSVRTPAREDLVDSFVFYHVNPRGSPCFIVHSSVSYCEVNVR